MSGAFLLHDLSLDTHEDLPYMLNEALWNLSGVIIHIVALKAVGVICSTFSHYLDRAPPVTQLKHIALAKFQPFPPHGEWSY